jgi:tRNA dimethylallyltransferase
MKEVNYLQRQNDCKVTDEKKEYTYERLQKVDAETAAKLHPTNIRKIQRSLEIFDSSGQKQSDIIENQQNRKCRYSCRIIWLDCDREVHDKRLRDRVSDMMNRGLLSEVEEFVAKFPMDEKTSSKGVFQAMGFKEFLPILGTNKTSASSSSSSSSGVSNGNREVDKNHILAKCVDSIVSHHRHYSKRQLAWIRNKFMFRDVPIYRLDTTDTSSSGWNEKVLIPAHSIAKELLQQNGSSSFMEYPNSEFVNKSSLMSVDDNSSGKDLNVLKHCELCDKLINPNQWGSHIHSKGHRSRTKKNSKPKGLIPNSKRVKNET